MLLTSEGFRNSWNEPILDIYDNANKQNLLKNDRVVSISMNVGINLIVMQLNIV